MPVPVSVERTGLKIVVFVVEVVELVLVIVEKVIFFIVEVVELVLVVEVKVIFFVVEIEVVFFFQFVQFVVGFDLELVVFKGKDFVVQQFIIVVSEVDFVIEALIGHFVAHLGQRTDKMARFIVAQSA